MSDGNKQQSINPFENVPAPAGGWGAAAAAGGAWGQPSNQSYNAVAQNDVFHPSSRGPVAQSASSSASLLPPAASSSAPSAQNLAFTGSTAIPETRGMLGSAPAAGGPGGPQPVPSTSDTRPLLATDKPAEDYSKYAFYDVRKYRPYFDVDTKDVVWRVLRSLIGVFIPDFMEVTNAKPDLYGPFWVATTLVLITAVAGNLSSYIAFKKDVSKSPPPPPPSLPAPPGGVAISPSPSSSSSNIVMQQWFADPTKLGTSAAIFYGYTFLVSFILWFWIKYLKGDIKLINMFCVYGYAMTIFIPVSIVCVVPLDVVHWVVVMVATIISALFLLRTMRHATQQVALVKSIWLLAVVALLHIALGIALKLYFFKY